MKIIKWPTATVTCCGRIIYAAMNHGGVAMRTSWTSALERTRQVGAFTVAPIGFWIRALVDVFANRQHAYSQKFYMLWPSYLF